MAGLAALLVVDTARQVLAGGKEVTVWETEFTMDCEEGGISMREVEAECAA